MFTPSSFTVLDVATQCKRQFGDESGVQLSDSDIIRWTNAAQREICSTLDIIKASGTVSLIPGTKSYAIAALKAQRINSIHVDGVKLTYVSFQDAQDLIMKSDPKGASSGMPTMWYDWAGEIYLYPIPDNTYTLTVFYFKLPTPVTDTSSPLSLPDEYFNRIVEFVMANAYEMDEDSTLAQIKQNQFQTNLRTVRDPELPTNSYPMITVLPEDM